MTRLEIYRLEENDEQRTIGTFSLSDSGVVEMEGDESLIEYLQTQGILIVENNEKKRLYPSDGVAFLRALEHVIDNGYLSNSGIHEE